MFKSLLLLAIVGATLSSPVPQKILYDQRQEGEWNVLADLKNFVVLVIPTSSSSTSSAPSPGSVLADFLFRSVPKRGHVKKGEKKRVPGEETMHFIESKTAPYHVDISRSKSHLAKLHPEVPEIAEIPEVPAVVNAEEIVIAKSPSIELVKDEKHSRVARAFVVTVPHEEKKKEGKKRPKEVSKSVLKLLGAENEQCGPGLARDDEGVCRTIKD